VLAEDESKSRPSQAQIAQIAQFFYNINILQISGHVAAGLQRNQNVVQSVSDAKMDVIKMMSLP
jgi:hypothetical protein